MVSCRAAPSQAGPLRPGELPAGEGMIRPTSKISLVLFLFFVVVATVALLLGFFHVNPTDPATLA
jgi:hypothetical protein